MLDLLTFKATDVPAENVARDFSEWRGLRASTRVENDVLIAKSNVDHKDPFVYSRVSKLNDDDILFMKVKAKPLRGSRDIKLYVSATGKRIRVEKNPKIGTTYVLCGTMTGKNLRDISISTSLNAVENGNDIMEVSNPIYLNLTEIFGKGNEPSENQVNEVLENFPEGYFEGTKNLFNAHSFMKMYFKKMKELENAITDLGGEMS